jgi:hypothetical protein
LVADPGRDTSVDSELARQIFSTYISMMLLRSALVVFLTATPTFALAQTDPVSELLTSAMNNLSHEYTQCAAYFYIVSAGLNDTPDTSKQYSDAGDAALELALSAAQGTGLIQEAIEARLDLAMNEMISRMNESFSNISILFRDYSEPCILAMEDPVERLKYWVRVLSEVER